MADKGQSFTDGVVLPLVRPARSQLDERDASPPLSAAPTSPTSSTAHRVSRPAAHQGSQSVSQHPSQQAAQQLSPQIDDATTLEEHWANHKGKLAVGVAAMLGAAIFYKWRESQLAKADPEEYARLQRLKDKIRERELHLSRDADDDLLRGDEELR